MFILLLIFIIKDTMKLEEQLKRIKELLSEDGHRHPPAGGTDASSSGSYISADSFKQGGILNSNGRKDDIGELPQEVDITGGDSEEITLSIDDVLGKDPSVDVIKVIDNLVGAATSNGDDDDGRGDPKGGDDWHGDDHGDDHGGDDHPTKERVKDKPARDSMDFVPCCEPCGDGMWKSCGTDDCIYSTISDCELRGDNDTYSESTKSRTTFND